MRPYIYNVVLAGLASAIVLIPFLGPVYLRRRGISLYKRFTYRGRLLIFLLFITIDVGYHKDLQADIDDNAKTIRADSTVKAERKANQDFILMQQQASNKQIILSRDSIVFALAKSYNLLLDSTGTQIHSSSERSQALIERMMKDSALRQNKFISNTRPSLSVNRILLTQVTKDSVTFQLKLYSDNATAYEVRIKAISGYFYNGIPFKFPEINLDAANGDQLSAGSFRTIEFKLPFNPAAYIFYIKGTYEDIPQVKMTYPLNQIIYYDMHKKAMSRLSYGGKQYYLGFVKYWL